MRSIWVIASGSAVLASCIGTGHDLGGGPGSGSNTFPPVEGDCPGGDTCSPKTPRGLEFFGLEPGASWLPNGLFNSVHNHIANGGTDEIGIAIEDGTTSSWFRLPFDALTDDPAILTVERTQGPTVTLREHSGVAHLRIVDPTEQLLFDRYAYASSEVAEVRLFPVTELYTGETFGTIASAFAFYPGDVRIVVAMLNNSSPQNRLIDSSLQLTLAGATHPEWDTVELEHATVGHGTIVVERDSAPPLELGFDVADRADAIVQIATDDKLVCFAALANGAYIAGIPWTYTAGGSSYPHSLIAQNCIDRPSGITVTAAAGGKTLTTVFP